MQIIGQLGIIFAFGFAGEILAALLPFTLPSSVIGLVLLLFCLRTGLLKVEQIGGAAGFLTANMAFFFLPSAVNILANYDMLKPVLWKLVIICFAGAALTFLTTYGTVWLIRSIQRKGGGAR